MMNSLSQTIKLALVAALAGVVATGPAIADRGDRGKQDYQGNQGNQGDRGGGHRDQRGHGNERDQARDERHGAPGRFEERQRVVVRQYYDEHYAGGRCPPGLAKKRNGCLPPGQAKKWRVGRPLPREVVYYEVPQPLVVQIGLPPPGYRYVRVAGDILLIAVGTGMVIDAIQDLGRM